MFCLLPSPCIEQYGGEFGGGGSYVDSDMEPTRTQVPASPALPKD
jgi:hypothetical protein